MHVRERALADRAAADVVLGGNHGTTTRINTHRAQTVADAGTGSSLVCHLLRLGREHGLEPRPRAAPRAREQRVLRLRRHARRRTPRRARAVLAALTISAARQVRRELRGLRE